MSDVIARTIEVFRKGFTFTPIDAVLGPGLSGERSYGLDIGDGGNSSLVQACVSWIANAVTQTTPAVVRYNTGDDFGEIDRTHPAARLVRRPTFDPVTGRSSYSWIPMMQATLASFTVNGNSYLRKRRSGIGKPVQLWYHPADRVKAVHVRGSRDLVDYYEIRGGGETDRVQPKDMIHFRDGIDPNNPLIGVSKLLSLLREIYTDERAAQWVASLLTKQAVPGLILSPEPGAVNVMTEDEAKLVKARLDGEFTGDNRGSSMVLGSAAKLQQYGFSPEQMKLGELRDIPEERVAAALGVQAAVVGFGAGLQTAKVGATMASLVDLSWQNGVIPRLKLLAAELTEQLLSDFEDGDEDVEFVFDTSRVPIMAEHQAKIAEKHERLMRANIETRSEARRAVGLRASKDDDIYTLQAGVTMNNPDGTPQIEPPKPAPPPTPPVMAALPAPEQLALPRPKALTEREARIVTMIADGLTTKAISGELGISNRTVEREIAQLMEKADVDSRIELVSWLGEQKPEPAEPQVDPRLGQALDELASVRGSLEKLQAMPKDDVVLRVIEAGRSDTMRMLEAMHNETMKREAAILEIAKSRPSAVRTEMEVERDENGRVLRSRTVAIPEES